VMTAAAISEDSVSQAQILLYVSLSGSAIYPMDGGSVCQ
jgi:hypothetical protein